MHTPYLAQSILTSVFVLSMASCALFSSRETASEYEYMDDPAITAKIKEAFVADSQVKASQINVETMGGVVQLSGFVDSPTSEARAIELTHQVSGVKSVKDDIIVRSAVNNR